MVRRFGLLFLVAAAALSSACSNRSSPPQRILVVTVDTLRWDRLGVSGHDVDTPNIDGLAATGTRFTHAVTVAPLTLPAHSSLFTGLYPTSHGVRANGIFRLDDELTTLAETFSDAGYQTGAFVGSFVLDRRFGLAQGFDLYEDELPEDHPMSTVYFAERPATEVVASATSWIRGRGDEPFFAWVHVFDPHAPYDPPSPFAERYPDRPYDGEIAYTDDALGSLFELVSSLDDSVIVLTADHGESLGEHGESTHGLYIYDSTTRVPLILSGSGIPAGRVHEGRVRIIDVAPTLVELAGLEPRGTMDGESLFSALAAEEPSPRDAYAETLLPRYSFNWSELRSIQRGDLKFIQAPRPELFDVVADPNESTNLWDGPRAKEATTLASRLVAMQAEERQVAAPIELDESTARQLESLGYISSTAPGAADEAERVDPKDRVEVYERMQALLSPDLTPEETIAGHRRILELEPTNTLARNRLANTLSEQGLLDEAIEEYRRLVRDSGIDFKGFENLSAALLLRQRTEEALASTEMAVAAAPWNPDFLVLRGEALEQSGRVAEARDAYASAAELEGSAVNHWRLGAVLEKLDDPSGAEARYRRAFEVGGGFEPAAASLARLLSKDGRTAEAFEILRAAPQSEIPETPDLATATAEAYIASGEPAEALAILEEARHEFPDNTRVLALLGPLYAQQGRAEAAIEVLEAARALGETSPEVRRNLAVLYMRAGRPDAAVDELEAARDEAPDSSTVWYSLGNAYFQAGSVSKAVGAFERALELRSDWPAAAFNLGMAARQLGQDEKAAEAFRRYLRIADDADARRREEAEKQLRLLAGES